MGPSRITINYRNIANLYIFKNRFLFCEMEFSSKYYDYDCEPELLQKQMMKHYMINEIGYPYNFKQKKNYDMLVVKDTSEERRLKERLKYARKQEKEAREREYEARLREHNAIIEAEAAKQTAELMVNAKLAQLELFHGKPSVSPPQEEKKVEVLSKEEVVIEKKEIQEEIEKSDDEDGNEDECVICMDAKLEMVFVPCGHFITCSSCCKVETCPKCRAVIQTRVRLYK